ncbi:MAG: hypothetical protein ACRDNB_11005 [Gaiellaceae bacterium]
MRRALVAGIAVLAALAAAGVAGAAGWQSSVSFTNQVASSPFRAGGYAGYDPGATAPNPGSCRLGDYNANLSESWIAVKPGTEDLVGTSKVFFEKFSTFYNFHLGSIAFQKGKPVATNIVQGYECVSTGTEEMPPSWTNNTDPNVAFDSRGRAYQVTLPFNAFWANLHPNSNIGIVYSDDLGRTWVKGNGGEPLEHAPNWSSLSFGFVEDKQWIAVDHFATSRFRDRVYAAWAVFNGFSTKVKFTFSADRGATFARPITLSPPNETGPSNTYVYPAVDAAGNVYVAYVGWVDSPAAQRTETIFVSKSVNGGRTWGPFVAVATPGVRAGCCYANTRFRIGIIESFAASETHPGHVYLTWEDYDGEQYDVMFAQSIDGGLTWSAPAQVNDPDGSDQFQPTVAAGPNGGVAIAFYDRRLECPAEPGIRPENVGRSNVCVDVTLQAYRDSGAGAVPVGGNVRFTKLTWDPEQPAQTIDGIDQMACAAHVNPCTTRSFIGDYFGLAVSAKNVYGFFVSTRYPSAVIGDQGTPVHYQQQILATASRGALGIG